MDLRPKRFNDETIQTFINYFQQGGASSGINLLPKDAEILERVRFADEKIRERKYRREDISNFIRGKFDVCRDTAYKDIIMAESVFSSSYPLNKQSIIALRIEFLQKKIDECFIDKEFVAASLLEKNLQKYIEMYKDYQAPRSPKTIVYNIQNNIHQTNVTVEQAIEEVDALVLELDKKEDY